MGGREHARGDPSRAPRPAGEDSMEAPVQSRAVVLSAFLEFVGPAPDRHRVPNVLDGGIRSKRTLEEVRAASSAISKRWGIVTVLQPEDFVEALRGARAGRR